MQEGRVGGRGQAAIRWARRALPWAVLVAALAWGLGGYPLLDPDEGRNGEVAREMAASGDYVLPHLDGLPYLDKPVLFFAVDALSQRVLGVGEAAARLPALLFALATAALTGWLAGRLFGRRARAVAAAAAIAAPLPLAFARTVIFDSALTFFMVAAIAAFFMAVEAQAAERAAGGAAGAGGADGAGGAGGGASGADSARHRVGGSGAGRYLAWTVAAWAAMGLGVLTKGPVALAVPLLAAVPYAVYRRASRAVWHPAGVAALAVVVGPWIWAMSVRVPEFLHYALFTETWQRVTTTQMNREGPIWLYVPCILAGALPWSVLPLAGWRHLRWRGASGRLDPRLVYLFLWIALPFVMFSLTHSKRPQYILPLLPAVAILAAKVWVESESPDPADADSAAPARPEVPDAGAPPDGTGRVPARVAEAPRRVAGAPAAAGSGFAAAGSGTSASVAASSVADSGRGAAVTETAASAGAPGAPVPAGTRAAAWTWLAFAVLFAAAAPVAWRSHAPSLAHVTRLPPTLLAMAAGFLAGAVLLAGYVRRAAAGADPRPDAPSHHGHGRPAFGRAALWVGLVLPIAAMPALALPLLDEIGAHRSSRAAAAAITPLLAAGGEGAGVAGADGSAGAAEAVDVVGVRSYPPSLPFYLRRTILVASPRGRELTSNYVIAYFQKWITADPALTPLRPLDWWPTAVSTCDRPRVFVAWADDAVTRAALAGAGLPLLFANDRMAAYGPCRPRPEPPRP